MLTLMLVWLVRTWRRNPRIAWFLGVTLLMLLPISNVLPLPFLVVAPYRAALPWIGLAAVLGRVFGQASEEAGVAVALKVALAGVFIWHSALSAWGSVQWRSEQRIFSRILQYDPMSIVARTVYTFTRERLGKYREAAEIEEEALGQVFGSEAWREWSTAEVAILHDPAVKFRARRNQGTDEDPRIWIAGLYAQLANCLMEAGDNDAARKYLQIGDRVWSNHLRIHLGLGAIALADGDASEAMRRYRMVLALDKSNATAHSGLGYAYGYQGRWTEAAAEFELCLRIRPNDKDAQNKLKEVQAHLSPVPGP
jgi:tetratricopeptide (TPR) repeat protein